MTTVYTGTHTDGEKRGERFQTSCRTIKSSEIPRVFGTVRSVDAHACLKRSKKRTTRIMSLRDHGPTARRQPLWSMSRSASSRALALTVVALSSNVGVALTATHSETESRFVLSPFAVAEDEMLRGARLADTRHADTRHEDAALQGVGFTTNGTAPLAFVNSTMLLPPLPNQEQRLAYLILFLSMVCVLGVATLLCCAQWQPRKSLSTWLLRRRDAPIGAALSQLTRRRRMHGVLDGHAVCGARANHSCRHGAPTQPRSDVDRCRAPPRLHRLLARCRQTHS